MTKLSAFALWCATLAVLTAGWLVWFFVGAPRAAEINAIQPAPAPSLKIYADIYLATGATWIVGGILTGLWCGAKRWGIFGNRVALIIFSVLFAVPYLLGHVLGYPLGLLFNRQPKAREPKFKGTRDWDWLAAQPDVMEAARDLVRQRTGADPGAWIGWSDYLVTAPPRGGVLVIGPPGSGKTTGIITPTVMLAPGACVSSSIKSDVMNQTAAVRARHGRVWHFDPDGDEITPPGVEVARWSPLASVRTWDDALRIGKTMGDSLNTQGEEGGGSHFVARATDWVQCLLYAATLNGANIGTVAAWAATAAEESTASTTLSILEAAHEAGDEGAGIAFTKLRGLLLAPDRERGSIVSTMTRLLAVYDSLAARRTGENPNFDPAQFVRSRDTIYITARPDKQNLYAPLLAALLEQIRFATYDRQKRIMAGLEPAQPHVTFALDEANTTAPIPIPSIISEAGGQGLHVVVGVQALGPSEARWGRAAASFLTLFPTKIVLRGVFDRDTVSALSVAAGEYDRQMVSESQGQQFLPGVGMFAGKWADTTSHTYSTVRQRVIDEAAITGVPPWQALVWSGADWGYVAHRNSGCSRALNPPASSSDLAM